MQPLNYNQKAQYDQTVRYLDIIFLYQDTVALLKTDLQFQALILQQLKIVAYYEQHYELETLRLAQLTQIFSVITERQDLNWSENYEFTDEQIQEQHHLNEMYLNDRLNTNIQEMNAKLQHHSLEPHTSGPVQFKLSEHPVVEKSPNNPEATFSDRSPQMMSDEFAERLIQQQAVIILNRRLANGSVYAFKTKPLIIPVLKWSTVAITLFMLVISIAAFIVVMLSNYKISIMATQHLHSGQEVSQPLLIKLPFPFQALVIMAIAILLLYAMIRKQHSDNVKYRYLWAWALFYIAMILMVTFLTSGTQNNLMFDFKNFENIINADVHNHINNDLSQPLKPSVLHALHLVQTWRNLQFVIYACIIAALILTILGVILNPKKDYERMQQLLESYVQDLQTGKLDINDIGNVHRGFFMQDFF